LVALSRHKVWVFGISGALIAGNLFYVFSLAPRIRARALTCPVDDPRCSAATRLSKIVLWISAAIWTAGSSPPSCSVRS
jgi:hypothetical protein